MLLVALILALCGSVEALTAARGWAPAQMARSAAALRTAPVRAAPVMQFGKKKLSPEEVHLPLLQTTPSTPALLVSAAAAQYHSPITDAANARSSQKLEEMGYWPGEWLCADCGYIYEPGTSPPFEELRQGWKCPQCAGPRRRFIKKAGDMRGRTSKKWREQRCPAHAIPPTRLHVAMRIALWLLPSSPWPLSTCRLGTLDDTPLFLGTAGAFVLIFGLVYLGLTV